MAQFPGCIANGGLVSREGLLHLIDEVDKSCLENPL